MGNTAYDAK
jgi:hypothetical protein